MPSGNHMLRHMTWLLFGLTMLFVVVWKAPVFYMVQGLANYLPIHMFAETFSIIVSTTVFGVAWNSYSMERPGNIIILACALLAVGAIDFAHMLSFKGMPDFITPSGPEKAINFWLAARLVAALTLLTVALRPWQPLSNSRTRYGLVMGSIGITLLVVWAGLFYPQVWPRTFVAGQGLTPFKIGAEYAIIAILLVPFVSFYKQARRPQSYDAASLFTATGITILSELSFTLYSDVADIFNLLGHLYKIAAYVFIYRAVFVASVHEPFQRLDAELKENRRITKELRTASLYSRSLFEANLDPLLTISPEGKISDLNKATEEITGMSRVELIGTDFSNYFTESDKAREVYQRIFGKGCITDYPLALLHRDGHVTDVLYNASVYHNEAGEVLGVLAAARDITERKKAEEKLQANEQRLQLAIRCGHLGVWELDLVNHTAYRTLEHDRIFGYESLLPQWTFEMFLEHVLPEERLEVNRIFNKAVENKTDWNFECRIRRIDGAVRWIWANGSHQRDIAGVMRRMIGIVQDITERKQAEERIKELNCDLEQRVTDRTAQLEAANKELESFSYSVSHDLRTPLRAIDGFSHILLEDYADKLDEEGKRVLNVVRDNTQRMGLLIDDILAFSRSGRTSVSVSEIDMEKLAHAVVDELQPDSGKVQVEIEHIPATLGDPAMMHQVFVNLLSNAIKFSSHKEPAMIKVGGSIKGDETVYFVQDNGAGFDMHYADKLFGVFQRLHSESEFEGTGIGLAIVKRIITRHGGRVWAEGKVNEGATIYFSLPRGMMNHEQ